MIELAAVLTVTTLLAATFAMRWFSPWQSISYQADMEKIQHLQQQARDYAASSHQTVMLTLDDELDQINFMSVEEQRTIRTFTAMGGVEISGFTVPGPAWNSIRSSLVVSQVGSTSTFAVKVSHHRKSTWLVFAGRTGQCIPFTEESDVKRLFQGMSAKGIDAY